MGLLDLLDLIGIYNYAPNLTFWKEDLNDAEHRVADVMSISFTFSTAHGRRRKLLINVSHAQASREAY